MEQRQPDDEVGRFIEEERDRRAVRAWYGNMAFFGVLAVVVLLAVVYVIGSAAG